MSLKKLLILFFGVLVGILASAKVEAVRLFAQGGSASRVEGSFWREIQGINRAEPGRIARQNTPVRERN